jgi:hypothetical protein
VGTPAHKSFGATEYYRHLDPSGDLSLDTCVPYFVLGGQKLNAIFALDCLHARPFQPLCGNSTSPLAV